MTSLELIAQGLLRAGDVSERIQYLRVTGLTSNVAPTNGSKLVRILRKFVTNSMNADEEFEFETFLRSYLKSNHFRDFMEDGDFGKVQRSIDKYKSDESPEDELTLTPITPVYDAEDSHDLPFEKLANRFLFRRTMTAEERFQFVHFLGYEYMGKSKVLAGFSLEFIDNMYSTNNVPLERLIMSFLNNDMNITKWHAFATYLGYDTANPTSYENIVQTRRIIGSVQYWRGVLTSNLEG